MLHAEHFCSFAKIAMFHMMHTFAVCFKSMIYKHNIEVNPNHHSALSYNVRFTFHTTHWWCKLNHRTYERQYYIRQNKIKLYEIRFY